MVSQAVACPPCQILPLLFPFSAQLSRCSEVDISIHLLKETSWLFPSYKYPCANLCMANKVPTLLGKSKLQVEGLLAKMLSGRSAFLDSGMFPSFAFQTLDA